MTKSFQRFLCDEKQHICVLPNMTDNEITYEIRGANNFSPICG